MPLSRLRIDRLLKTYKKRPVGKGWSYIKPGTLLKTQIPVRTFADWNEKKIGSFEIDLCGHDGGLAKGDFGWTLDFVDVKSCWAEQVAVKNKAQIHVFTGIEIIRFRLPFSLLGIDSDSGSEFINHHLHQYCIPIFTLVCPEWSGSSSLEGYIPVHSQVRRVYKGGNNFYKRQDW